MPDIRLIAYGLLAAGLLFSGWTLRSWYDGAQDAVRLAEKAEAEKRMRVFSDAIAKSTEAAIQGIRVENKTITNEVQKEVIREPVYQSCVLPNSGRVLINRARRSTGKSNGTLSAAPAAP